MTYIFPTNHSCAASHRSQGCFHPGRLRTKALLSLAAFPRVSWKLNRTAWTLFLVWLLSRSLTAVRPAPLLCVSASLPLRCRVPVLGGDCHHLLAGIWELLVWGCCAHPQTRGGLHVCLRVPGACTPSGGMTGSQGRCGVTLRNCVVIVPSGRTCSPCRYP